MAGKQCGPPRRLLGVAEDGGDQSDDQQLYAGDVDDTELSDAMYKGLISGLGDKYSTYYTKEEYEAIKTAQEGYYQASVLR